LLRTFVNYSRKIILTLLLGLRSTPERARGQPVLRREVLGSEEEQNDYRKSGPGAAPSRTETRAKNLFRRFWKLNNGH